MAGEMAQGCAWIDGRYVSMQDARIPVNDAGFTRSDVTYDVVGVWQGRFFRLDDHLDRFERGRRRLRLSAEPDRDTVREVLHGCVSRSGLRGAYVEMIATRGVPPAGVRDPRKYNNAFYAFAVPYVWIEKPADQENGCDLVVARHTHRIPPGSVDPTIKNFHWGDLTAGLFEAFDRDAAQVVLLDTDDRVTEGPGYNLFAASHGRLHTLTAACSRG